MLYLSIGLALWCGVHLLPSTAISFRQQLISQLGEAKYSLVFAVLVMASIVLMVFGWRSIQPVLIYAPPVWSGLVTVALVFIAFIFFSAANFKSNIKRFVRHPQLTGLVIWSAGHLFSNGDDRSLLLFGGLGIWAMVEIILINKREGDWLKPERASFKQELLTVVAGAAVFFVFSFLHPYLSGVPIVARLGL